jgi:hypothetical protein
MGCCVLIVESAEKWKMWFSDMLEPYVHYVPVRSDLSDLIDQIKWCQKNDGKCKAIARTAFNFSSKYLTKKGILDNLQKTLFKLHSDMNMHHSSSLDPLLFQTGIEHDILTNTAEQTYKVTGLFPKNIGRNYGTLKGLEKFITQSVKPDSQITLIGVEVQTLFKSKTTKVTLYQIGSEYVVGKKTIDEMKKLEFIHEAFIGKYVINSLLKVCPNFVFTLGYRDEPYITYLPSEYGNHNFGVKESTVMQEYIRGPTLQEFLRTCTFKSFLEIILSLSCALTIAQENYGFVHHDLKPWNIMVNILPEPIIIEYYFRAPSQSDVRPKEEDNRETVYKIKTKYIPIIIDYGKSHVIYNNVHYGIIEPFVVDKYVDLVTLLLSTINELVLNEQKENVVEKGDLIFISNFLSVKKITSIHELKNFLYKTKKFGNLNLNDIHIDQKSSSTLFEEFFKYITPLKNKYKIGFGKDKLTSNVWSSNARQISDMGFGLELDDKINSYLDVARRIYKNPMPQATNRFTTIMIAQRMFDGIAMPKMEFIEFATKQKLNPKKVDVVLKEFDKIEKFTTNFYTTQLNKKVREPFNVAGGAINKYDDIVNFKIKPTRSLFLGGNDIKVKLEQEMKHLPAQFPDYTFYRNLILDVLRNRGPFRIQDDDIKYYMDNFRLVFDEKYTSKVVDIETIRFFMNM